MVGHTGRNRQRTEQKRESGKYATVCAYAADYEAGIQIRGATLDYSINWDGKNHPHLEVNSHCHQNVILDMLSPLKHVLKDVHRNILCDLKTKQ